MKDIFRLLVLVLLTFLCCALCACSRADRSKPPQKVTIAIASIPEPSLASVAYYQGFFRQEGLDETAHFFPYGKVALQELLQGKADFATVAETPVMFAIMKGAKISILATIASTRSGHAIVARRDRGINGIGDLKGKKIGTTLGTSAQFFLDAMLLTNGVARKDVTVADMPAEKIPDAFARGEVDAVAAFAPYTIFARNKAVDKAVVFTDPDVYRHTFNIVATQDYIRDNPAKVRKVLRALIKAENLVRSDPASAQEVIARVTGLDKEVLREIWRNLDLTVSLDQTLILALEDESDWAIKNGLTTATKVPNYLNYVYLDGLTAVKPKAVRILK